MASALSAVSSPARHRERSDFGLASTDALRDYLSRIGSMSTLSADDEVSLAVYIEAGLVAAQLIRESEDAKVQSPAPTSSRLTSVVATMEPTQIELELVVKEGQAAYRRFIYGNLKLVVSAAKHFAGRGLGMSDLIQNGNLGLDRAVKSFDYRLGFRFSTHAMWWIRQAIWSSLAAEARTIRIPVHALEKIIQLRIVKRDFTASHGREPSEFELACESHLPVDELRRLESAGWEPLSLDLPVGFDAEDGLGDLIVDDEALLVSEIVDGQIARQAIRSVVAKLPPREGDVVRMRFGLDGSDPMSLSRIGATLGVSKQRARQLELRALKWLRCSELKEFM